MVVALWPVRTMLLLTAGPTVARVVLTAAAAVVDVEVDAVVLLLVDEGGVVPSSSAYSTLGCE